MKNLQRDLLSIKQKIKNVKNICSNNGELDKGDKGKSLELNNYFNDRHYRDWKRASKYMEKAGLLVPKYPRFPEGPGTGQEPLSEKIVANENANVDSFFLK